MDMLSIQPPLVASKENKHRNLKQIFSSCQTQLYWVFKHPDQQQENENHITEETKNTDMRPTLTYFVQYLRLGEVWTYRWNWRYRFSSECPRLGWSINQKLIPRRKVTIKLLGSTPPRTTTEGVAAEDWPY